MWPYGPDARQTCSFLNVGTVQHGILARLKAIFDPKAHLTRVDCRGSFDANITRPKVGNAD